MTLTATIDGLLPKSVKSELVRVIVSSSLLLSHVLSLSQILLPSHIPTGNINRNYTAGKMVNGQ